MEHSTQHLWKPARTACLQITGTCVRQVSRLLENKKILCSFGQSPKEVASEAVLFFNPLMENHYSVRCLDAKYHGGEREHLL